MNSVSIQAGAIFQGQGQVLLYIELVSYFTLTSGQHTKKMLILLVAVAFCCFTKTGKYFFSDTLERTFTDTWRKPSYLGSRSGLRHSVMILSSILGMQFYIKIKFPNEYPTCSYSIIVFITFPMQRLS